MQASKDIRVERKATILETTEHSTRCIITSVARKWRASTTEMYEGYILLTISANTDDEYDQIQTVLPIDVAKKLLSNLNATIKELENQPKE